VLIVTFSYIATNFLGHEELSGTDSQVEEQAATSGVTKTPTSIVSLSETGENIGFTLIGVVGGLAAGYWYVDAFYERGKAHG
jgi:hypothetical protein